MRKVKLVVIGAGTAGLTALTEAKRVTEDVLLINDGPYGTTCARVGCMPSKALLAVAHGYHARRFLGRAGVTGTDQMAVDLPAVMRHVRELRDQFTAGPIRASQPGEHSIAGRPRFVDANTLEVGGETIRTEATIIATGTRPVIPQPWQALGDRVVSSDTFFELQDPGQRVAVIGLGAIGAELGQALGQLGVEVHGFNRGEQVGGLGDPEISAALAEGLAEHMQLHLGAEVELEDAGQRVRVKAGNTTVEVDRVLAALGRRPNLEGLGLETLGAALDDRGIPEFDAATLRLGELPVFIAGDVNNVRPLMHEAADEGRIAAYNALHPGAECLARRAPLAIVFTAPNAARVGLGWRELPADVIIGSADFRKQSRAVMTEENRGRLHVYAEADSGRLLGAEMAVPEGEHLAHLLAWAIQQKLDLDQLLQMPFYHPVVEEGLRTALQSARKQLGPRRESPDLPLCREAIDWALG